MKNLSKLINQGKWRAVNDHPTQDDIYYVKSDDTLEGLEIATIYGGYVPEGNSKANKERAAANAEAICSAVNNTYGVGVDANLIPEMLELIKDLADMHPDGNPIDRIKKAVKLMEKIKNG